MAELAWTCGFTGASVSSVFSTRSESRGRQQELREKPQTGRGSSGSVQLVIPKGPSYKFSCRATRPWPASCHQHFQAHMSPHLGINSQLSVVSQSGAGISAVCVNVDPGVYLSCSSRGILAARTEVRRGAGAGGVRGHLFNSLGTENGQP